MKNSKRILSITLRRRIDTDPDTSYLGEYSNRADGDYSIDRAHSLECRVNAEILDDVEDHCNCDGGDQLAREYRYFNTSGNYKGEPIEDIRTYTIQDYKRMESLNRGDWGYMGIDAVAEVQFGTDVVQQITSGGLWGIESDSDANYFAEVEQDELANLRNTLHEIGFSKRAIATAFKAVQRKDA